MSCEAKSSEYWVLDGYVWLLLGMNETRVHECRASGITARGGKQMADQILRDKRGTKIGTISTASNGVQTLRDAKGVKKGTYDPRTNKTKDVRGSTVGTGNLLATFL